MGLAPVLVEQIFETITGINQLGTTVLLVEQNAYMALQIAQRGYVLQTGEIALSGSAAQLQANAEVRKAYLGGSPAPLTGTVSLRTRGGRSGSQPPVAGRAGRLHPDASPPAHAPNPVHRRSP